MSVAKQPEIITHPTMSAALPFPATPSWTRSRKTKNSQHVSHVIQTRSRLPRETRFEFLSALACACGKSRRYCHQSEVELWGDCAIKALGTTESLRLSHLHTHYWNFFRFRSVFGTRYLVQSSLGIERLQTSRLPAFVHFFKASGLFKDFVDGLRYWNPHTFD